MRKPRKLPDARADYSFGDLVYFHLFKFGTRPTSSPADKIGHLWDADVICPLIGIDEKTLRNWISGATLPDKFPSILANELFGSNPQWQDAKVELLHKWEEGRRNREKITTAVEQRSVEAQSPAADIAQPDPKTDPIPENFGNETESGAESPSTSRDKPYEDDTARETHLAAMPDGNPPVASTLAIHAPRKANRLFSLVTLTTLLLLATGGFAVWQFVSPFGNAGPPSEPPQEQAVVVPNPAPTPIEPLTTVTAPIPEPPPTLPPIGRDAVLATPLPPPPPPPLKTGVALFEGTWRVTTIPTNNEPCGRGGRTMQLKIDSAGRVTDMCVVKKRQKRCGESLAYNIRRRTVGASGQFNFSYVIIPEVGKPQHENWLSGILRGNKGNGEVTAWQDGERTICPAGRFEAERLD